MKCFLITFNRLSDKNYSLLDEEIKDSKEWWSYLDNSYIVLTDETVEEIWQRLEKYHPKDGRLLIVEIKGNYQGWLETDAWKWLDERLNKDKQEEIK